MESCRKQCHHARVHARILVLGLAIISCIPFLISLAFGSVNFDPSVLSCVWPAFDSEKMMASVIICFIVAPLTVSLVSNVIIVRKIFGSLPTTPSFSESQLAADRRRRKESTSRLTGRGMCFLCCAFICTYVPMGVISCLNILGVTITASYNLFKIYPFAINTLINPLVFVVINRRFRSFVRRLVCLW